MDYSLKLILVLNCNSTKLQKRTNMKSTTTLPMARETSIEQAEAVQVALSSKESSGKLTSILGTGSRESEARISSSPIFTTKGIVIGSLGGALVLYYLSRSGLNMEHLAAFRGGEGSFLADISTRTSSFSRQFNENIEESTGPELFMQAFIVTLLVSLILTLTYFELKTSQGRK